MPPVKKTAAPRKPQDRKPKKTTTAARDRSAPFVFTAGGEEFELPSPEEAAGKVSGRVVRDAIMDPSQDAQMRLAFATLESSGPDSAALDALYDLPAADMLQVVADWFEAAQGANPGES